MDHCQKTTAGSGDETTYRQSAGFRQSWPAYALMPDGPFLLWLGSPIKAVDCACAGVTDAKNLARILLIRQELSDKFLERGMSSEKYFSPRPGDTKRYEFAE